MSKLSIHMLYDLPVGAYHHYCALLCNALVAREEVGQVALTAVFSERQRVDVDPEEMDLVDPKVAMVILGPGGGSKFSRYCRFFANFVRHWLALKNDGRTLVHLHTATGLNALDLGLLLAYKLKGIPIVRTIHELTAAERLAHPTGFELWFGRLLLRLTDAVIVHDPRNIPVVRAALGRDRTPVAAIPHGNYLVFRKYMPPSAQGETNGVNEKPVVLFLGVKRHKGIEVFLQAMRQLQAEQFPVQGIVTGRINPGDEDLLAQIEQLANVKQDASYVPNRDMWRVYRQADVVAMPYLKGTTSGAVHLAYAFERPVIASDIDCFKGIVGDGETGLIVPQGDAQALAAAIKRLCENQNLCRRLGRAGFERVSSGEYSWEAIAQDTLKLYRQALASEV